ncbi:hypothetical protein BDQ12DRAFT_728027 [Crucibulum laeve]|uniref:Uncharacterized protein n=1 Tax=Crucibulum laeve TaxID=68775 RepID=A0A5C3LK73_9AGAR|nr:hypothetical protein BDQ12DRAFT_728027 [Crucibulum laeve]
MPHYPSASKPIQNTQPPQPEGTGQYSPEYIQRFLEELAYKSGVENDENLPKRLIGYYGTMEEAVYQVELMLGMGNTRAHCPLPDDTVALGEKPKPGEHRGLTQLSDNVSLRVWDKGLERIGILCFDFVYTDDTWRYMTQPDNVRIEAIGPTGVSEGPVLSIEKSFDNALHGAQHRAVDRSRPYDADWESFVVPAGTHIRIWQGDIQYNIIMTSPRAPAYTSLNWS